MKCPYCQKEMEKGVIQSIQEIAWLKKKHLLAAADLHSREKPVILSPRSFWKGSQVTAYLCRDCEKVIIDYSEP